MRFVGCAYFSLISLPRECLEGGCCLRISGFTKVMSILRDGGSKAQEPWRAVRPSEGDCWMMINWSNQKKALVDNQKYTGSWLTLMQNFYYLDASMIPNKSLGIVRNGYSPPMPNDNHSKTN